MLRTPSNQKGRGLDWMNTNEPKHSTKHMTNQYTGHMNDGRLVQMAQMPNRKGNHGDTAGPVTAKDAGVCGHREFMPSRGQNYKGNPDKIQMPQMPNKKGNGCC